MSKAISTKRRVELSRQELAKGKPSVDWEGVDLKELNELTRERIVQSEWKRLKKQQNDIALSQKGADWKVSIAKRLCKETTANNPWIAERLKMAPPNYVSNLVNKS